jgi:hypothetical protein
MTEPETRWETLDWSALDRMRNIFLSGWSARESYWTSRNDVANYDFTYAQRIGWKWDAVLRELNLRGWTPPAGPLLDWGCGSGMAGRRVLEFFGAEHFTTLRIFDRSSVATDFAADAAREAFYSLPVEPAKPVWLSGNESVGVLAVSHVLNELDEAGRRALRQVIDRADAVLWVEPGTFADSRALIAMLESLREKFLLVAPCTHQCACGLLAAENDRHWCHHFAKPPPGIMSDANWVRFAQRAGIDLRSLPYSFLVLERKGLREPVPGLVAEGWSRVIGAPRVYKGFAKVLSCQAEGVRELELQKRDAPKVFRAMKNESSGSIYRWTTSGGRIEQAEGWPAI